MSGLQDVVPHRVRAIPAVAVLEMYHREGWWPERTEEQVARVLEAGPAVGAWDASGQLVGFVRAVTDVALRAYVEDLVVLPERRGREVGRELLAMLEDELSPVTLVTAFCAAGLAPYYEAVGFRRTGQVALHHQLNPGASGGPATR